MASNRSGHVIREHRERAGLSRSALAKKIRISASYLSKIESCQDRPSPALVVRMLRALELTGDHSERVEQLRCMAVKLPSAQIDRIVLHAAEAGEDFDGIQARLMAAKQAWMEVHGAPDARPQG